MMVPIVDSEQAEPLIVVPVLCYSIRSIRFLFVTTPVKARKYIHRNRTTPGRATGSLFYHLSLPAIDAEYYRSPLNGNPARAIGKVRHFVESHLPTDPALLKDASLVMQAEIRVSGGGVRRKHLATWKFGDDLDLAFKKAMQEWSTLEFEDERTTTEIEVDFS